MLMVSYFLIPDIVKNEEVVEENYQIQIFVFSRMSFENMELLGLHSCIEIKEEMSEVDETISGDPIYVNENQTEIKVEEGKDELTSIIAMVHVLQLSVT